MYVQASFYKNATFRLLVGLPSKLNQDQVRLTSLRDVKDCLANKRNLICVTGVCQAEVSEAIFEEQQQQLDKVEFEDFCKYVEHLKEVLSSLADSPLPETSSERTSDVLQRPLGTTPESVIDQDPNGGAEEEKKTGPPPMPTPETTMAPGAEQVRGDQARGEDSAAVTVIGDYDRDNTHR